MLRRRSAAYEAPAGSFEPATPARHDAKSSFLDLRVDMSTRASGARPSALVSSKALAAAASPSHLQHALRRCQSASTIRKKLLHAVEQSSSQMTHDQLALLRRITAAKPTPKALLSRQLASPGAVTTAYSVADSRPSSAAGVSLPPKHRHPDTFASSTPTRALSLQLASTEADGGQRSQQRAKIIGGFKSGSVQLEVELVERLNEIDRSKLNEKAVSRFRACQRALDAVILQDEPYSRLLAKIRDEVNVYVDYVSRNNRTEDCACGGRAPSNQSSGDLDFENALVRQENQSLKKACAALQREVQVLQHSLQFATSLPENAKSGGSALAPELEQDDGLLLTGDELSEIPLLSPVSMRCQAPRRPPEIPALNLAALSLYSDELDDDDDDDDFDNEI